MRVCSELATLDLLRVLSIELWEIRAILLLICAEGLKYMRRCDANCQLEDPGHESFLKRTTILADKKGQSAVKVVSELKEESEEEGEENIRIEYNKNEQGDNRDNDDSCLSENVSID